MRRRNLLIGLVVVAISAILGGVGVRLLAAHRFQGELAEARNEMGSGLLAMARKRLTRLAEQWPGDAEVAYQLGLCEAARGRLEAALECWGRIPGDSPWAAPAAINFAQAGIQVGRVVEVERMLRTALRHPGPEAPALRRLLLTLLGQQGRIDEARRLLESFWTDPALLPAGDFDGRLAVLREHVSLDFEPFPLEWNLSVLAAGSSPAGEDDRLALAVARAHLATRSGDFARAEALLREWLPRRPDDPVLQKAWLDWAVPAGRFDLARAAIARMPADQLHDARRLELRAWFARRRRDVPAERAALEALLALEPGRTTTIARLAELLQGAADPKGAAALMRRKTELDAALDRYFQLYKEDRYASHLPELAALADRLGRTFEARGFWELTRDRAPDDPSARSALARLGRSTTASPPDRVRLAEMPEAEGSSASPTPAGVPRPDADRGPISQFEDRGPSSGLAGFIQDNGASPIQQLPEMFSGGVGLLDYDGDGFLDVYCVQGGVLPTGPNVADPADRLYRNRGDGTFEDVTRASGIGGMRRGYGHGVAVGDYDNDGRPDLFVTRWRSYALYRNRGDGTFEDVTEKAGLLGDRDWPTSSAFADLDNDGDLDLYVCHYGVWDTAHPQICTDPSGTVNMACDPRRIESLPDHVFRNDGGRFVDATAGSGIVDRTGRGLGVVAADLDQDGRIDIYVANDTTANFLFRNLGGFRFEEIGHEAGVAANAGGGYQAGMGVACGDLDGDGRLDLAVTNFYGESTSFFHNLGQGLFADHTAAVGLAAPSRHRLGFGIAFLDADVDGWLDLMTANGHIGDYRPLFPYAMTPQLFAGGPGGVLSDVTAGAGPPFQRPYVGRGLAVGDLDNDGRPDAVLVAQNEPLVDLRNKTGRQRAHFVTFQLEGTGTNRDGVGAVVAIVAGGRRRVAPRLGGGSFQSAGDPRLHFGLGPSDRVESVEVRWPSGRVDRHRDLKADRGYHLREGDAAVRLLSGFPG
jgi:enediyne biosynthesis protein E4